MFHASRHHHAVGALVIGAIMISFSGVWVKVSHVTPTASAFYRVFFGGIILLPAALFRREMAWHGGRHLFLSLVCGFLFAIDLVFYHYSVVYVGPGLGTILPNFQVFILAATGIFLFGEKVRVLFLISIPLAFIGLFLIVGIDWGQLDQLNKIGVYFGLAAAVCYAAFLLFLRKLQSDQAGVSFFYVLMMVSLSASAVLALEIFRAGDTFSIPDLQSFFALVALGLFSQTIGWMLITNALPAVLASLSGFILLLQPALAFVWDVLLFQRPTSLINWIGVFIVLIAIYFGSVKFAKH
ncbi:MAG: DMT family transporter [Desulfobacterales bacterium]|nr:MAG: DMT family transporter [Desulfobacterales bacterium]UCD91479.1 MAG: DMT family transporter [Desulfobacterales bacterium]